MGAGSTGGGSYTASGGGGRTISQYISREDVSFSPENHNVHVERINAWFSQRMPPTSYLTHTMQAHAAGVDGSYSLN
eukprot:7111292-Pyramimonas_sp.AAC.1